MKKYLSLIAGLLLALSILSCPAKLQATTSDEFKVGLEAAYAPFNWTQYDDKHGAVPIQGVKGQYANGYDVQVAKNIAKKLGKKLVIVKTSWDGLLPALTSGKIDAIIAGMSPTAERREQIDFSAPYFTSSLGIMVNKNSHFAQATQLSDFKNAKLTAQLGTFHYNLIDQVTGANKQPAMKDFSSMRVALQSGAIDGYVAEKAEGITAQQKNPAFKFIALSGTNGFKLDPADTTTSIGLPKNSPDLAAINAYLADFSTGAQNKLMDKMIAQQPDTDTKGTWWTQLLTISKTNGKAFFSGTGMTLFISLISTILGTLIGLLIGVFRTKPQNTNPILNLLNKIIGGLIAAYIEIFRGTPMIVQAMVLYYGSALAFGLSIDRTVAALIIVSINTGAYMSEIVRGGIFAVDKGQFEAAQALGMTHNQAMRKVILPQVLRNILPATGNEFVINIKDTSVLSVISVSELFFQGNTVAQQNFMYFQTFAVICAIYFVLTFTITRLLRLIERKLDGPNAYTPINNQMQVAELKEGA